MYVYGNERYTYTQTDICTHALIHKHINDDEDHEKFLLSSEVLLEPYADATSVP